MKMPNRDLLVLLKSEFMSQKAIEQEVECLNDMLRCYRIRRTILQSHMNWLTATELLPIPKNY